MLEGIRASTVDKSGVNMNAAFKREPKSLDDFSNPVKEMSRSQIREGPKRGQLVIFPGLLSNKTLAEGEPGSPAIAFDG